ncbi:molybdenum cofactor biosynthesis protein MoaE [Lutimonas saemankumensis]|uniref:molybdenum cofactor biosynthesis protein MoaE n=1 Tax=Lutimonas saemankumensis TaxID=483016 RepID=UPI001CD3717A|nr:molybdenum cofactor biosynthesis protein MoaE [Lutimonas saemankumensis]MCA0932834.1 molybdenum cofactor biosynthesis protein MoaE [Lutimonas saemankumensis]
MRNNRIFVKLTEEALSLDECYEFVRDEGCGGLAFFVGTVRNRTEEKEVLKLEFSAYDPMAVKEMSLIAVQAVEKFGVHRLALHHTKGVLAIGEVPVIVAVSSAHREAAFKACQYAIDTLKKTVPIWKKEYFEDGEVWVNAHP